ncbi:hypothetical protein [Wolbachia endosymbiont of Bemisia tabaci]|uniref:hypothetical protein n=1 Tax=Wolbachia endosymbiont of Bemisia tabaci TaxID=215173 RepID=UPI000D54E1FD|nr:hypothetical protein [Wolbachia endosymbiont of Bemisia tabaci]
MDTKELKNLQENLLGIISFLIVEDDEEEINRMQNQALEIISKESFKEHINDAYNRYTILDAIKKCSVSVGQSYIEKHGLAKIEQAIKDAGGKTSEELERNSILNEANNEGLVEAIVEPLIIRRQRVAETSRMVGSMIGAFLGGMIYSKVYREYEGVEEFTWTESLMNGFTAAVCTGAGFLLGKIIIPINPANLENAAVEQPNMQQR